MAFGVEGHSNDHAEIRIFLGVFLQVGQLSRERGKKRADLVQNAHHRGLGVEKEDISRCLRKSDPGDKIPLGKEAFADLDGAHRVEVIIKEENLSVCRIGDQKEAPSIGGAIGCYVHGHAAIDVGGLEDLSWADGDLARRR